MPSPVGTLTLVASPPRLVAVLWQDEDGSRVQLAPLDAIALAPADPVLVETRRQLTQFFAGTLDHFTIPLEWRGTSFQCAVWQALVDIPYGCTRTYGEIAAQLGRPAAWRAVGAANGKNPLSIIVPCHRLVGASGSLRGFAGGLATKRWLLDLEVRSASRHAASEAA